MLFMTCFNVVPYRYVDMRLLSFLEIMEGTEWTNKGTGSTTEEAEGLTTKADTIETGRLQGITDEAKEMVGGGAGAVSETVHEIL